MILSFLSLSSFLFLGGQGKRIHWWFLVATPSSRAWGVASGDGHSMRCYQTRASHVRNENSTWWNHLLATYSPTPTLPPTQCCWQWWPAHTGKEVIPFPYLLPLPPRHLVFRGPRFPLYHTQVTLWALCLESCCLTSPLFQGLVLESVPLALSLRTPPGRESCLPSSFRGESTGKSSTL